MSPTTRASAASHHPGQPVSSGWETHAQHGACFGEKSWETELFSPTPSAFQGACTQGAGTGIWQPPTGPWQQAAGQRCPTRYLLKTNYVQIYKITHNKYIRMYFLSARISTLQLGGASSGRPAAGHTQTRRAACQPLAHPTSQRAQERRGKQHLNTTRNTKTAFFSAEKLGKVWGRGGKKNETAASVSPSRDQVSFGPCRSFHSSGQARAS